MKRWAGVFLFFMGLCAEAQQGRFNFNRGWLLSTGEYPGGEKPELEDASWQRVTLPHAWNEDDAYRVSIHDQRTGVAWYRKHFQVPAAPGTRTVVAFEGARLAAEVFLNGHRLGISENGVMAFGFDLTPYLQPGDNVLAVRTDNRWNYREVATGSTVQWNNDNFYSNFGGIHKNVWLHVLPAIHQTLPLYSSFGTTGQYIWTDGYNLGRREATIHVESEVKNESSGAKRVHLGGRVLDLHGRTVARFQAPATTLAPGETRVLLASVRAKDLHFWSWGYGYLYKVVTTLAVPGQSADEVTTSTGFRQTAFQHGMVYLNGRVLDIHGYAGRSTNEWPALGTDVPPWISDFSNGLMVEDNADLIRWMHVTPSRQDVESCDRVGLPQSMPAGDAEGDPKGRQWQARVELMRDSIVYNRNSPSILFYESGNKGITEEHMKEMVGVRDRFDPHGGRAIGSREMMGSPTAEYGGEMLYVDKSAGKPLWAHEYNRDEGARRFWNAETVPFHKDSPLYNRDQDSFTLEDVLRWDDYFRARPGTGTRVSAGGVNISWIDENSHFRGDNNYRRSGEVDAMRIPKDAFFAHQVMWDGWVNPEHPRVHLAGHWNYPAGTVRTVTVIGNSASVELRLNGRSLGVKRPEHDFLFVFPAVSFEAGVLEATSFDEKGRPVASDRLETAGKPVALRLRSQVAPGGLRADGSDLALVDVEVVDAAGHRVPTALNMVHFDLQGPAEWRGGIAQGSATPVPENKLAVTTPGMAPTAVTPLLHQDNYILSRTLPVEGGINRISLRTREQAGTITLTATADGLASAHLTLRSTPVNEDHGLSRFDPAAALPSRLERGPTPPGPSFSVTRMAVPIQSATAGANPLDAAKSFDDQETTSWTNASATRSDLDADGYPIRHMAPDNRPVRGTLDTAWIEYSLAGSFQPTDLELKLSSFRTRQYPLRVTLDGEMVYEGLTPRSLGYVDLPLHATRSGTKLKVALTGPPIDVDDAHPLVEVNGTIDQAHSAGHGNQPILGILEAEIYAKPAGESRAR